MAAVTRSISLMPLFSFDRPKAGFWVPEAAALHLTAVRV
jgi:hypothetical protein